MLIMHSQSKLLLIYVLPPPHAQLADAKSMINIIVSSIKPTIYIIMNYRKMHQQSMLQLAQQQVRARACALVWKCAYTSVYNPVRA